MRARIVVGLIGAPLVFGLIYWGGLPFYLVVAAIMVIGIHEYCHIASHFGWHLREWLLTPLCLLILLTTYNPSWGLTEFAISFSLIISIGHALWQYEFEEKSSVVGRWMAFVAALVLFGWMGGYLIRLRLLDGDGQWTMGVLAMIWSADVWAYFIGRKWGKRPLSPRLSPKKSIEGYLAGIVLGPTLVLLAMPVFYPDLPIIHLVWMTFVLTIIMPAGDLFFSLLKREAGVKDAGKILPGHGGILDRLDTVLWGATIGYYLLIFFVI